MFGGSDGGHKDPNHDTRSRAPCSEDGDLAHVLQFPFPCGVTRKVLGSPCWRRIGCRKCAMNREWVRLGNEIPSEVWLHRPLHHLGQSHEPLCQRLYCMLRLCLPAGFDVHAA